MYKVIGIVTYVFSIPSKQYQGDYFQYFSIVTYVFSIPSKLVKCF